MGTFCSKLLTSKEIRAIVFDYGEVIWLHSRNMHIYKSFEQQLGVPADSFLMTLYSEEMTDTLPEGFRDDLLTGKFTARDLDTYFTEAFNKKNGTSFPFISFYSSQEYDAEAVYEECILIAISKLRKLGYTTILLMNTFHMDLSRTGRRLRKLNHFFDHVFESCIEGYAKPDPQIFRRVLQKLRLSPQEVLLLDDEEDNCHAAADLGIRVLQVLNTMDAVEEMEKILRVPLL